MLCPKQPVKPTATRHLRINAYGRSRQHDRHGESRHQPVGRQYRKRGIPELEEKHITVVNSLKPKIQLRGNYSLLYSIFRNLMDNAIAYAGTDIRINISCFREDENFYYFSFADTGVGVSPEHLNRLFERFYRVDKGRSRKLGGTGLGLAIVKNSVIIHGGTISAKNNQGAD